MGRIGGAKSSNFVRPTHVAKHGNVVGPPGTSDFSFSAHKKRGGEMFAGSGVMSCGLALLGWLMSLFDIELDGIDFSDKATQARFLTTQLVCFVVLLMAVHKCIENILFSMVVKVSNCFAFCMF